MFSRTRTSLLVCHLTASALLSIDYIKWPSGIPPAQAINMIDQSSTHSSSISLRLGTKSTNCQHDGQDARH
ncbi:hypothetical protein DER46DRAFT_597367 [Fusarium sp. MPI-SDFR-AT-0072]|nr:hypothetical protein DER46DRAFT_597367 [Fusarium sp. MPI-SDFR-AT-0072]